MPKIVITGCGIVSSVGTGFKAFSENLQCRRSGITEASFRSGSNSPSRAGEIIDLEPERFFAAESFARLGKTTIFSILAGKMAAKDARLELGESNSFEAGLIMGSHYGEFKNQYELQKKVFEKKPNFVSPNRVRYVVPNTIGGEVCIRLRTRGYNCFLYDAEVSSALSVVMSNERLLHDASENHYIAGGSDSINEYLFDWHRLAGNLAVDEGAGELSRPFDEQRNGFIIGEGSGMVALERLDHALERGSRIHCELAGCAVVSSSARDENGDGISEAMVSAIKRARLERDDIGAVVANANSTKEDMFEAKGIRKAFKNRADAIPVTSLKSLIGEVFGAAGAMSVVAGISILEGGIIFPILNYHSSGCGIDVIRKQRILKKPSVIINSISRTHLRTTNVSIVLKRLE